MKNALRVMAGLAMAFVMVVASGCGAKVSDFRAQKFQELKAKVDHEPAWVYLMQKVLDARHGSVRAKSIEIEDLTVNMLGGDDVVRRDMSNLKSIEAKFRVTWDGKIHKDGFTCTTLVFDKEWNLKRIVPGETDAKIDHASLENEPGGVKQAFLNAKEKVGGVVDKAKIKLEEMKPQLNEAMQNLEQQFDAAIQSLREEF